jgi:hypothetical protein
MSDLSGLLLDPHGLVWKSVSLGTFVASLVPMIEAWGRYALQLSGEFRTYSRTFLAARRDSANKAAGPR